MDQRIYSLEGIWYFSCSLCIVCVMQCESKEPGVRDKHVAGGVSEKFVFFFFHLVFGEFTINYMCRCL